MNLFCLVIALILYYTYHQTIRELINPSKYEDTNLIEILATMAKTGSFIFAFLSIYLSFIS